MIIQEINIKPTLNECFADNGAHSHWELIDSNNGKILWSESTEQPSKDKELELLNSKLSFYREQTDNVRQLVFNSKEIGEPCQPLYDAICDKINSQSKEIESLKTDVQTWKAMCESYEAKYYDDRREIVDLKKEIDALNTDYSEEVKSYNEKMRESMIELLSWYNGHSQRKDVIEKNVDDFLEWYKDYKPLFNKPKSSLPGIF